MIWKHLMGTRRLCFLVQLLQQKVVKIIHIEEALNIKVQITQQGGCFFSVQLFVKKINLMKSRIYMKAKHKTYKQELSVFSATTDRKKRKKLENTVLHNDSVSYNW